MEGESVGSTPATVMVPELNKRATMSLRLEPTISLAYGRPMRPAA